MKIVIGIATCIWFFIMVVMSSSATQDAGVLEQLQPLGAYETVTYDLGDGVSGYRTFLTNLLQKFKASEACDLPVTRDTLPKGKEYVLADLKISDTRWVTVALKVTNLYLVAYRVNKKYKVEVSKNKYEEKYVAAFFKEDDINFAKGNLFKGTDTKQEELKYDSNYKNIESEASISRKKIPLGIKQLQNIITAFYEIVDPKSGEKKERKDPITGPEEAKFLLVAIQMVSEATRFSYIEDKVVESGDYGFKPDKTITLQTSWQKKSEVVHKAEREKKCESQEVKDIKKDTKLLIYKKKKANVFASTVAATDVIDGGVLKF